MAPQPAQIDQHLGGSYEPPRVPCAGCGKPVTVALTSGETVEKHKPRRCRSCRPRSAPPIEMEKNFCRRVDEVAKELGVVGHGHRAQQKKELMVKAMKCTDCGATIQPRDPHKGGRKPKRPDLCARCRDLNRGRPVEEREPEERPEPAPREEAPPEEPARPEEAAPPEPPPVRRACEVGGCEEPSHRVELAGDDGPTEVELCTEHEARWRANWSFKEPAEAAPPEPEPPLAAEPRCQADGCKERRDFTVKLCHPAGWSSGCIEVSLCKAHQLGIGRPITELIEEARQPAKTNGTALKVRILLVRAEVALREGREADAEEHIAAAE
ncbi:MAG TPA: hypothetical protein VEA41_13865, partial [Salinarimonas sp.]|nr:hypothetical protein [Salinarimonas sp.]